MTRGAGFVAKFNFTSRDIRAHQAEPVLEGFEQIADACDDVCVPIYEHLWYIRNLTTQGKN